MALLLRLCVSHLFLLWKCVKGKAWTRPGLLNICAFRVLFSYVWIFRLFLLQNKCSITQVKVMAIPKVSPSPVNSNIVQVLYVWRLRNQGSVCGWGEIRLVECGCVTDSVPNCFHFSYCLGHCQRLWKKAACWAATGTRWLWLTWMLAGNIDTAERWNKGSWRRQGMLTSTPGVTAEDEKQEAVPQETGRS